MYGGQLLGDVGGAAEQDPMSCPTRCAGCGGRADGEGDTERGTPSMGSVVVVGPRSVAVPPPTAPGGASLVELQLVALRRGVQRLPAFLVVAERDGRPLDSVHDVQVLVS